jgi:cobalt-zinc-cadmium efflux system membrane fusion protein
MSTSLSMLRRYALVTGVLLAACGRGGEKADSAHDAAGEKGHGPGEGVVVLDTAAIRLGGIRVGVSEPVTTIALPVTGTITYDANRVTHVGSRTDGRVVELNVDLGRRVERGQILVELESADVGQIRAEEQRAEALLAIATENHNRERRLEQQGISSRKELLEAEAEVRRAEAELRSARDRLKVLGAGHGTGGHFDVGAPISGTIVARNVSVGQMATASDTLFTVADLSRVWIELDVFERDLSRVSVGQNVSVSTDAFPDRSFPGRIVYVGEILDPAKRTVQARVDIPNTDGALRPGMFAKASIRVGGAGVVAASVPRAAVQEVEGKKVVFVPGTKPGEFRAVPVEVGEAIEGGKVVILSGLSAGARVVVAGAFALRSELEKAEIGEHGHGD